MLTAILKEISWNAREKAGGRDEEKKMNDVAYLQYGTGNVVKKGQFQYRYVAHMPHSLRLGKGE